MFLGKLKTILRTVCDPVADYPPFTFANPPEPTTSLDEFQNSPADCPLPISGPSAVHLRESTRNHVSGWNPKFARGLSATLCRTVRPTTETSLNCNKACGGKLNLRTHIFCKRMTLLRFQSLRQHHAKLVEPYFLFLHTFIIHKLFIKH